ncbi:MAG: hypothetical protein LLG15_04800 [Betaproteobacteria bacterium]|nr:hypothetical protein [Betaproteobacteria bacterium]
MRAWLLILLMCLSLPSGADEIIICYNYGCAAIDTVEFDANVLNAMHRLLVRTGNAAEERDALSLSIGLFEISAGLQTPTWADKGGNANDDGVDGRMDCIDESTNTNNYLLLLEGKGWLRFHRVLAPVMRAPMWFDDHWAARIVETQSGREFAVDSWFFDNGRPAFVAPLEAWRKGAKPE